MHNKTILTLFGLLATTQITMAMDPELLMSDSTTTATSTQPLSIQSGRTKRSHSNPPSTLHRSISVSPIDDYDLTRTPNSSQSSSQPSSPRKQKISEAVDSPRQNQQETTQKRYPKYTGYYTNELNSNISHLPNYTHVNSGSTSNNIDMIVCTNKATNEDKTILFYSDMQYNTERYIVIINDEKEAMFTITIPENNPTESEEAPQDTLQKRQSIEILKKLKNSFSNSNSSHSEETAEKQLKLLQDKFGSSSSSDSEQQQSNKELSNSDSEKKHAPFHYLTSTHPDHMPNDVKIYQGTSMTQLDFQTSQITYFDDSNIEQTICVNNGASAYPTFAIILDNQKQVKFAIKLPEQETKNTKSPSHRQAFTPNGKKPQNGYGLRHAFMGATFIAFCIALMHRYNQLPDAFAKFLDNLCTQWDKLIVNHFTR